MNFSAIILAGGKSSRMGRDKAWLEVGGTTLLARQIELARMVGASEVFISGRVEADYSAFDGAVLTDYFQSAGPLSGIERGLNAMTTPLLLVLAVDMPRLEVGFLRRLVAASAAGCGVIPHRNKQIEPLVAIYPKAALPLAIDLLRRAQMGNKTPGPTDFARLCVTDNLARLVSVAAVEATCFTNFNSPEDLPAGSGSVL
jgi:molybdopterin-guanine dinucleotide biosynthesis protein A